MALGAEHMRQLRAQEEARAAEVAAVCAELVGPLRAQLAPETELVVGRGQGRRDYSTFLLEWLFPETHAQMLVHNLQRQMAAFKVAKVDRVYLEVQGGQADWPRDLTPVVRAALLFDK